MIPRGAPSFLISALRLKQRRGGARHRPQRPFLASGQSRENKDGGPQGNQDAVPALLEREAQPRGARGSGVREALETPARWTPGAPRRGWLSGSHSAGPPGRGAPQRPPPGQGSQAYLAGSCARCCPSSLQGAALAAARSGLTGANYAVDRGPGPGSGRGASLLHSRAGGRQLGREPVGRRWRPEEAEPPVRARGLRPRLPSPPTAPGGAGPRPPHLLKVCTRWRENRRASRPRRSRARDAKARGAAGCPRGAGLVSLLAFHSFILTF